VATGLRLLRTDHIPDEAATLRHHAREHGRFRPTSDDSEWNAIKLLELNNKANPESVGWGRPSFVIATQLTVCA
jgi:hypothetical protein